MSIEVVLQLSVFICLYLGCMLLADGLIHFPRKMDKKDNKVYTAALQDKRSDSSALTPVIKIVAKFVEVPEHRMRLMRNQLRRAEIDQTPQEYVATAIVKSALCACLAIVVYYFGIPIAAIGMLGVAVMMYLQESNRANDRIKKKDEAILGVLPHFVSVVSEQLKYDTDILRIFERYMRDVPDSPLTVDLNECCSSIRANGNIITALLRLDATVALQQFTPFLTALIETVKGYDQTAYFQICASEMEVLEQENIERKIAKRPKKIKRATLAMMAAFMLMLIVPIVMQLVTTMKGVL